MRLPRHQLSGFSRSRSTKANSWVPSSAQMRQIKDSVRASLLTLGGVIKFSFPIAGTGIYITAQDGLRLQVRVYGLSIIFHPVVGLPGLARTRRTLANRPRERRVVAIDSRGRGQPEYGVNPQNTR
jgi:hypothetical protein